MPCNGLDDNGFDVLDRLGLDGPNSYTFVDEVSFGSHLRIHWALRAIFTNMVYL